METPYMLIYTGNLYFLIETDRIEAVVSRQKRMNGEVPVFLLDRLCGLTGDGKNEYVLLLNAGDAKFGIAVEMAEGLLNVKDTDQLSLPEEVRCRANQYLEAAVPIDKEECPAAYCVNVLELYNKAVETEPSYWM